MLRRRQEPGPPLAPGTRRAEPSQLQEAGSLGRNSAQQEAAGDARAEAPEHGGPQCQRDGDRPGEEPAERCGGGEEHHDPERGADPGAGREPGPLAEQNRGPGGNVRALQDDLAEGGPQVLVEERQDDHHHLRGGGHHPRAHHPPGHQRHPHLGPAPQPPLHWRPWAETAHCALTPLPHGSTVSPGVTPLLRLPWPSPQSLSQAGATAHAGTAPRSAPLAPAPQDGFGAQGGPPGQRSRL